MISTEELIDFLDSGVDRLILSEASTLRCGEPYLMVVAHLLPLQMKASPYTPLLTNTDYGKSLE